MEKEKRDTEIFSATDFSIFSRATGNRRISQKKFKSLRDSVKQCDMLSLKPIIVNKKMCVIDGQHRLEVAKDLGIPIYYVVASDDFDDSNMILLNKTQDNWEISDYVNYYAENKDENYLNLIKFSRENNLSYGIAISCLGYKRRNIKKIICDKSFVFKQELADKYRAVLLLYKNFLGFLIAGSRDLEYKIFASFSFLEAISIINPKNSFDFFFEQLKLCFHRIRHSTGFKGYIDQLHILGLVDGD